MKSAFSTASVWCAVVSCIIAVCMAIDVQTPPSGRISDGQVAAPGQFPFVVGILISGTSSRSFCGGALISRRFVLTAAACVQGTNSFTVLLGATDMTRIEQIIPVLNIPSHIIVHPGYSSLLNRDDIALVQLSHEANLTPTVQVANLPRRYHTAFTFNDWPATVAGWGNTGNRDNEPIPLQRLLFATGPVVSNFVCGISHSFIRDGNICSSTDNGGPCNGDEGGPVWVTEGGETFIIGVHSFHYDGLFGCDRGRSSVHTRLTEYLDWIQANTDVVIRA
ncbi:brachyurin-like [Anopheles ziemanni]|uniref:brachyurin-like n=1 Tax=Anopheles coustani TaxID=139045 RepID=UPI002658C82F|nr:brachyurin-like [Anopheles coustani]XP_058178008.1 brachyurin-like [Anopheles ziemanni]